MVPSPPRPDLSVLLADGCAHSRRRLRDILLGAGMRRIYEAADGAEAIGFLEAAAPSLLVLDWDLAVIGAADLLRLAREARGDAEAGPAIVATVGDARPNIIEDVMRSGVTNIVVKPYSTRVMRSRIGAASGCAVP